MALNSPRVSRNGDQVAFWAIEARRLCRGRRQPSRRQTHAGRRVGRRRTLSGLVAVWRRSLVFRGGSEGVHLGLPAQGSFVDWRPSSAPAAARDALSTRHIPRRAAADPRCGRAPAGLPLSAPGESHERDLSWFGSTSVQNLSMDGRFVPAGRSGWCHSPGQRRRVHPKSRRLTTAQSRRYDGLVLSLLTADGWCLLTPPTIPCWFLRAPGIPPARHEGIRHGALVSR